MIQWSTNVSRRLLSAALTSVLVFGLAACADDDENPTSLAPEPFDLEVRFRAVAGSEAIVADDLRYTNAAGNTFSVTKFEILLTRLVLVGPDGSTTPVADVAGIDLLDADARTLAAIGVDGGTYEALRFQWGVRAEDNQLGFLDSSYDTWQWPPMNGGGYHCMRLEGLWRDTDADLAFRLHAGILDRFGRVTDGSIELTVPLQQDVSGDGSAVALDVYVDVLSLMNDPVIDLSAAWENQDECPLSDATCFLGNPSMPSHESQALIRDNVASAVRTRPMPEGEAGPSVVDLTPDVVYDSPVYIGIDRAITIPTMPAPEDNPSTQEGIALGRRLFHDTILSSNREQSCATCHLQGAAFADPRRVSRGATGATGTFNAPALINMGWTEAPGNGGTSHAGFFWDGRSPSLEDQALHPVPNPIEMNLPWDQAIERIQSDPRYPALFGAAFPGQEITPDLVTKAIAQFERSLLSFDSKYDRVMRGEENFTPEEARGFGAFIGETADCFHCHGDSFFLQDRGDLAFANNGLDSMPKPGLFAVTGDERDRGKFRTPTLRNVQYTAPYMHDGRFATLEQVIDHYSEGVALDSPNLDVNVRIRAERGALDEQTKSDLIAFLKTLSDPSFLQNPDFGPLRD